MFGFLKSVYNRAKSVVCGTVKAIGRAVAKVAKKVYDGAKYVATKTLEGAKKVVHFVNETYKKFTGQDVAEEAERRLAALEERTRQRQSEFKTFMEVNTEEINASLSAINAYRKQLNDELFPRFCSLACNFRNWSVADVGIEKRVALKGGCDSVRSREELMRIDFRNHPISANLLAVFTLGFATRKRAKESLNQVKEEEERMRAEFQKLDNEKTRISAVLTSLRQVERQFEGCIEIYSRVLDEVDYAVELLRTGRCILSGEPSSGQFDIEFLPERHLLALKAADEMTRIVFAIGAHRYVNAGSKIMELVEADVADARKGRDKCKKIEDSLMAA